MAYKVETGYSWAKVLDPNTGEQYILVKESDGRTIRMSDGEFDYYKEEQKRMIQAFISTSNGYIKPWKDPHPVFREVLEDPEDDFFKELAQKSNELGSK